MKTLPPSQAEQVVPGAADGKGSDDLNLEFKPKMKQTQGTGVHKRLN